MSSILYSNPQKLDTVVFAPGTFQLSSFSIFLGFSALTYIHIYIYIYYYYYDFYYHDYCVYIERERDIIPKQIEYGTLRGMYLGISIWVRGYWNVCVLSTPRWLYCIYIYYYISVYIYIYKHVLLVYNILIYLLSYVHMLHTHLTFTELFIVMIIMINR